MADVSAGLSFLHSVNPPIIHQDIKPANILIDSNRNYCITDFGISVKSGVEDDRYLDNESSGTTIYMPPERFKDGYKPDTSSDIWAFGATAYEILTGDVPFGNQGGAAQLEGTPIPPIKEAIPKKIKNIVYACLNADPQKRPSAEYIAEYVRRKGKNNRVALIATISIVIGFVLLSVMLWNSKPKALEPFEAYKNSGDSIISLQKQEAAEIKLLNYGITINRLNNAKTIYTKALKESTGDKSVRDSVRNRIVFIQEIIVALGEYKGVCDTLDFVTNEDLPTQIGIFSKKRDRISKTLKNKISNL